MSSEAPPRVVGPATAIPRRRPPGARLGRVALIVLTAVLVQVSVMPYVNIAEGIPDLVAPAVVAVGLLRGPLVGGIAGFAGGMMLELAAPIGTLGVLALLYLCVGVWSGYYCERDEAAGLLAPLALVVVGALAVQLGYLVFQLLLGNGMPASMFVGRVLFPTLALTALLSPPVLLFARRLLGAPRVVEPYAVAA